MKAEKKSFLWEKRRREALASEVKNERFTRTTLTLAPVVVALFLGMNLYVVTLALSVPPAWADAFVEFFGQQQIGQEIKVQGPFRRASHKMHFFTKDNKTGKVKRHEFLSTVIVPTYLIGNGSLTQKPHKLSHVVALYPDESLVKDLPPEGDHVWFIGTLLGYQYAKESITTNVYVGGPPYFLLKSVGLAESDTPSTPPSGGSTFAGKRTVNLKVEGMTCGMCPVAVEKALKGVEGVKSAWVTMEDGGKAMVVIDETVKESALTDAINSAGFTAKVAAFN